MAETIDTNLLASNRRARSETAAKPSENTPAPAVKQTKSLRVLKIVAYVCVFLLAFVFFLIAKIPDNTVQDFVITKLNQNTTYRWQAQKISFSLLPLPHLHFEALSVEPKFPTGFSQPINLEKLDLYPSLLGLISGVSASFDVTAFGSWTGSVSQNKTGLDLSLSGTAVDLAKIPIIQEMNWDVQGKVQQVDISLNLPLMKFAKAEGDLKLSANKIRVDPASFGAGVPLPILEFGKGDVLAKIRAGRIQIDKFHLGEPGKEVDLQSEGDIQLADNLDFSRVNLKFKLKLSDKIRAAAPTLDGMLSLFAAKKPDGIYAAKLNGSLGSMGVPTPDP